MFHKIIKETKKIAQSESKKRENANTRNTNTGDTHTKLFIYVYTYIWTQRKGNTSMQLLGKIKMKAIQQMQQH